MWLGVWGAGSNVTRPTFTRTSQNETFSGWVEILLHGRARRGCTCPKEAATRSSKPSPKILFDCGCKITHLELVISFIRELWHRYLRYALGLLFNCARARKKGGRERERARRGSSPNLPYKKRGLRRPIISPYILRNPCCFWRSVATQLRPT